MELRLSRMGDVPICVRGGMMQASAWGPWGATSCSNPSRYMIGSSRCRLRQMLAVAESLAKAIFLNKNRYFDDNDS